MDLDLTGKRQLWERKYPGPGPGDRCGLALLGAEVTLLARNEEKLKEIVKV